MALRADLVIEIEEAPAIAETDALLPTTGECTEFKKKNTTQNNSEETLLEGHQTPVAIHWSGGRASQLVLHGSIFIREKVCSHKIVEKFARKTPH